MKVWSEGFPAGQIIEGRGAANLLMPPNHPRHYAYVIIYPEEVKYYLKEIDCLCDELPELDTLYGSSHYPRLSSGHKRSRHWMAFVMAYLSNEQGPKQEAMEYIGQYHSSLTPDCISHLTKDLPIVWGRGGVGTWWRTMLRQPATHCCPGARREHHPVNGDWCQVCGWVERWIEIEGRKYEIKEVLYPEPDEGHFFTLIEVENNRSFFLAPSLIAAGGDAQMHFRWVAKHEPERMIEILGQRALAHWALSQEMESGIPGAPNDLRSFTAFLGWLYEHPAAGLAIDHWARTVESYHEGLEQDIGFAPKVAFRRS